MTDHYLTLTTYGRKSGKPHSVEVSFYHEDNKMYLLAHARNNGLGTDWYKNLNINNKCILNINGQAYNASFVKTESLEILDQLIRSKFIEKYGSEFYNSWYKNSGRLPVALELCI